MSSRPIVPATSGAEALVPVKLTTWPLRFRARLVPGAARRTQEPRFVYEVGPSFWSVAPTLITGV